MSREIEVAISFERVSDVSGSHAGRFFKLFPQTMVFLERRVDGQFAYFTTELFSEIEDNGSCTAGTAHA